MTVPREPRTPEEALAAALHDNNCNHGGPFTTYWFNNHGHRYRCDRDAERVLAALEAQGWRLVSEARPDTGKLLKAINFLRSVVASGERLNAADLAWLDGLREAADWRNAAIEAGGTGEIRPGGGVAE